MVHAGIEKRVGAIALAPDGASAVVVHRADPDSTVADDYERAVDVDEGYSLVDLRTGFAQLKRTGARPRQVAFTPSGRRAAVLVRDEVAGRHQLEASDLSSLVVETFSLASTPRALGAMPASEQVWVTQDHPAGRISVLDLEAGRLRTLTGFRLDAEIRSAQP